MEKCDHCKQPTEYNEYHGLMTKDTCLSSLGDFFVLCVPCGEKLLDIVKSWLEENE